MGSPARSAPWDGSSTATTYIVQTIENEYYSQMLYQSRGVAG